MCGLFGWSLSEKALEDIELHTLAAVLAFNAERRGDDSWGVASWVTKELPTIRKNIGSIKKTCKIRSFLAPNVLGHTRKATTGAITVENAHPFHIGRIIGAHNGFVFDHEQLNHQFKREFTCDSQHIFAHINEKRPIRDLSASGTVTYIDIEQPNTTWLGRGATSDLVVCGVGTLENCLGVVWASVGMWIEDALAMAGCQEHFTFSTKPRSLYSVHEFRLWEEGDFNLYGYSTYITPSSYCGYGGWHTTDKRHSVSTPNTQGDKFWEDYHTRKDRELTRGDLEHLPASLKKNQEIDSLASRQDKEAETGHSQCDSCLHWGVRVDDYEEDPGGIVRYPQIDQDLCFTCAAWWGSDTGDTSLLETGDKVIRIPSLKLWE